MFNLSFFVAAFWCLFCLASSKRGEIRNGCGRDDLVFFSDLSAQYGDLFLIAQNAGSLSEEFESLIEEVTVPELEFKLFFQDSGFTLYYPSRDLFLYGDATLGSYGYIADSQGAGDLWIYTNPGYGICSQEGNIERATYIQRAGDNIRGPTQTADDGSQFAVNPVYLARIEWTFVKDKSGDSEGYKTWRVESVDTVVNFFGSFTVPK